ncbi:aldehyde dehydrogenase family protein, partial [bacterium]
MLTTNAGHYIDGEWLFEGRETFDSTNPAKRSQVIGTVAKGNADDVDRAVKAAATAYKTWRELSWVNRAEIIDTFAQLLRRDIEEIAELVTRECGKPINEGRADAIEALHMAQYVAGLGRMPNGFTVASEIPAKDAYILRKPKGVVACITPWNFPSAIPLWVVLP